MKKRFFYVVISIVALICISLIALYFYNKETVPSKKDTAQQMTVLTLGDSPFKNGKNIFYKKTTVSKLKQIKQPSIILVSKEYVTKNNQKLFINLAKEKNSVLFYNKQLNPEEIVGYLEGIVPVVPIESNVPLDFQAYGVTTLDNDLVPIFVSVTSDQKELSESSFENLLTKLTKNIN